MPSTRRPGREKEDPPSTDATMPQMEAMVVGNRTPKPRWTYRGPRCLFHRRSHVSLHQDIHPASLNPQGGNVGPTDVSRTGFSGWESRAGLDEGPRAGRAAITVSGLTRCLVRGSPGGGALLSPQTPSVRLSPGPPACSSRPLSHLLEEGLCLRPGPSVQGETWRSVYCTSFPFRNMFVNSHD